MRPSSARWPPFLASPWRPLTREVGRAAGAARLFLDARFPRQARWAVQDRYRDEAGAIQVPPAPAEVNAGTLCAAFEMWLQLHLTPRSPFTIATLGADRCWKEHVRAPFHDLVARLGAKVTAPDGVVTGPRAPAALSEEDLLRCSWALALYGEVYRAGSVVPGSGLRRLTEDGAVELLDLASPAALSALGELTCLAHDQLLPTLRSGPGPLVLSPTFAGTRYMKADADLVAGPTLVEVKTAAGAKNLSGGRRCVLDPATLLQLLGYVLHDVDDRYRLEAVMLYQARYNYLVVWPLSELLADLAGPKVNLPQLRADWLHLLTTARDPSTPHPAVDHIPSPAKPRGGSPRRASPTSCSRSRKQTTYPEGMTRVHRVVGRARVRRGPDRRCGRSPMPVSRRPGRQPARLA